MEIFKANFQTSKLSLSIGIAKKRTSEIESVVLIWSKTLVKKPHLDTLCNVYLKFFVFELKKSHLSPHIIACLVKAGFDFFPHFRRCSSFGLRSPNIFIREFRPRSWNSDSENKFSKIVEINLRERVSWYFVPEQQV